MMLVPQPPVCWNHRLDAPPTATCPLICSNTQLANHTVKTLRSTKRIWKPAVNGLFLTPLGRDYLIRSSLMDLCPGSDHFLVSLAQSCASNLYTEPGPKVAAAGQQYDPQQANSVSGVSFWSLLQWF